MSESHGTAAEAVVYANQRIDDWEDQLDFLAEWANGGRLPGEHADGMHRWFLENRDAPTITNVEPGMLVRHNSGRQHIVLLVSNLDGGDDAVMPIMITYQDTYDGKRWSQPWSVFKRDFEAVLGDDGKPQMWMCLPLGGQPQNV